jgi:hypothetical protein
VIGVLMDDGRASFGVESGVEDGLQHG